MKKSILLVAICLVGTSTYAIAVDKSNICRSGQVVGGSTSRLKKDHDLKYIDAKIRQSDGSECELRLEIDDEDNTFDFGDDFFDGEKEDLTASITGGTFKVKDAGKRAHIKVDTLLEDGKSDGTWEGDWTAANADKTTDSKSKAEAVRTAPVQAR